MCGRFTLRTPASVIIEQFGLPLLDGTATPLPARFNIAPTQQVLAIRQSAERAREAVMLRWGLIPSWAKDPSIGNRMINARGESVAEKPSFRRAFRSQRCLVLTDGYYEWKKTGKAKHPYYFHRPDDRPFAFAGLRESWTPKSASGELDAGEAIESCTIITTDANEMARDIHDRMPVILREEDYDLWLDHNADNPDSLQALLRPADNEMLEAYPISTYVNKPANQGPECIEPI
jgi:putative SOS response-associated peptidase YedK